MSSVPKSERKPSKKFQVIEEIKRLRLMINNLLILDFGYSQEKYEQKIEKLKSKKYKNLDKMIAKYNAFNSWFMTDERKVIMDYIRDIEKEVNIANNIWIATLCDYDQRRYHFSEALGMLMALNAELQEIISFFPVDINKYLQFGKQIDKIVEMIKKIKKSDNSKRRDILFKKRKGKMAMKNSEQDEDDYYSHDIPVNNKVPIKDN